MHSDLMAIVDLESPWPEFLRIHLDHLASLDRAAEWNLKLHHGLRLVAAVSGVIAPALLAYNVNNGTPLSRWAALAFSIVTGVALAVDTTFNVGERYRNRRLASLAAKREGRDFALLTGVYAGRSHSQAAPMFMERVGAIGFSASTQYLADTRPDRPQDRPGEGGTS